MNNKPRYTFHYAPAAHFRTLGPNEDYTPPRFAEEGFIHCTDGAENMAKVANRFYKDDPRDFLVLYIDKKRVRSPIKYEDPDEIYPHIYGPLNQDAIVDKRPALRQPDGTFLPIPDIEGLVRERMMSDQLVEAWRHIIVGDEKSWVLFGNGTCVVLMQPEANIEEQAIELMKEWGPVHVGTPAGDFDIVALKDYPGWVVTCHHLDISTYVGPDEIIEENPSDIIVGLIGRSKRHQDAEELEVLHIEDKRKNTQ